MLIKKINKFRIVENKYAGYGTQIKYWFMPLFWFQIAPYNSIKTVEAALRSIISFTETKYGINSLNRFHTIFSIPLTQTKKSLENCTK